MLFGENSATVVNNTDFKSISNVYGAYCYFGGYGDTSVTTFAVSADARVFLSNNVVRYDLLEEAGAGDVAIAAGLKWVVLTVRAVISLSKAGCLEICGNAVEATNVTAKSFKNFDGFLWNFSPTSPIYDIVLGVRNRSSLVVQRNAVALRSVESASVSGVYGCRWEMPACNLAVAVTDSASLFALQNNSIHVVPINVSGTYRNMKMSTTAGLLLKVGIPSNGVSFQHRVSALLGGVFTVEGNSATIRNFFSTVSAASGAEWSLSPQINVLLTASFAGGAILLNKNTATVEGAGGTTGVASSAARNNVYGLRWWNPPDRPSSAMVSLAVSEGGVFEVAGNAASVVRFGQDASDVYGAMWHLAVGSVDISAVGQGSEMLLEGNVVELQGDGSGIHTKKEVNG